MLFYAIGAKKDADKIDDGAIDSSFTGYSMEDTNLIWAFMRGVIPMKEK